MTNNNRGKPPEQVLYGFSTRGAPSFRQPHALSPNCMRKRQIELRLGKSETG